MIKEDKLAKKSDKINFQTEAVRREFAPNSHKGNKKLAVIAVIACAIIAIAVVFVIRFMDDRQPTTEYSVDWLGYGEALAKIKETYPDYDKVILRVKDNEIEKLDFYKLRLVQDYMYAAFVEEFEDYVEKHKDSLTQEQIEESRPTRMTDEEIIENLIMLEIGYIAALEADVPINYAIAQAQMTNLYANNLYVLKTEEKDSDLYKSAKEFVDQIALIAKGMDVSVDEYLVDLSRDSMKSMAITMIEDRWQTEFRNSNFDGTVDEYIDSRYKALEQKYTVVVYGLE